MNIQITQPDTRVVSIKVNHMKIHDNSDIKVVKIDGTMMVFLTQNFGSFFPNITEYYIMSVKLQFIRRNDFRGIENLESISFFDNRIEEIPEDVFFDLKKLKFLSLADNKIANIPLLLLYNLYDLEAISLKGNFIENFPSFVFANNKKLNSISLRNNRLATFSSDLVLMIPKLKEFFLAYNTCINNDFEFDANDDQAKREISLHILSQCYLNNNFNYVMINQCKIDVESCKKRVNNLFKENRALEKNSSLEQLN